MGNWIRGHRMLTIGVLFLLTAVTGLVSLGVGFYPLSIEDVIASLLGTPTTAPDASTIVLNIRLPRILAAILVGSALSVSGSAYQGMFRNPLVSPDILGVSSGAGVGASFAISVGLGAMGIQLFAFTGGLLAVALPYCISRHTRHSQTLTLVLTGTAIGGFCSAIVTLLQFYASPTNTLPEIVFWLMGSLQKVVHMEMVYYAAIPMILGMVIIWLMRWKLNVLMLEDDEARSLGISPHTCRIIVVIGATLLSASAVCIAGLVGWIGLMIPHICRFIFGADFRYLVPASAAVGAIFLLIMDNIARATLSMEIPLSVITALIGAPFFLFLVLSNNKNGPIS